MNKNIEPIDIATDLYYSLNATYSSDHHDTAQEATESIELLKRAILSGIKVEYIEMKMRQMLVSMNQKHDFYKSKLSNAIRSRFWDKNYIEMIPYRPFKFEE